MSKVGLDLVEAAEEMAAHLRGEVEVESYDVSVDIPTTRKIREIRRTLKWSPQS